jgi:hypothetical protein
MANVLSEQKRRQVEALGRLGWSLRRIEREADVHPRPRGTRERWDSGRERGSLMETYGETLPMDLKTAVVDVVKAAMHGKDTEPGWVTAYQVLNRLPELTREELVRDHGGYGGRAHDAERGSGAANAVMRILRDHPQVEVSYFDAWQDSQFSVGEGIWIQPGNVTGGPGQSRNKHCNLSGRESVVLAVAVLVESQVFVRAARVRFVQVRFERWVWIIGIQFGLDPRSPVLLFEGRPVLVLCVIFVFAGAAHPTKARFPSIPWQGPSAYAVVVLAQDIADEMRTVASRWISDRTISVLVEDPPGALTQHGTAVLLEIGEALFVVSAAHVLELAEHQQLWLNPVATGARFIPVATVDVHTTEDGRRLDFGFFRVPSEYVPELLTTKSAVRLGNVCATMPSGAWYAVLGYPLELNVFRSDAVSVPTQPMYYGTRLHDRARDPIKEFDPAINIGLELALHRSGAPGSGVPSTLPDLHGMSGSGIWQLHHNLEDATSWSAERVRLAGIFHTRGGPGLFETASGSAAIVGVHFAHAIRGIKRQFPELATTIEHAGF